VSGSTVNDIRPRANPWMLHFHKNSVPPCNLVKHDVAVSHIDAGSDMPHKPRDIETTGRKYERGED
jgi:hypothetical protein